MYYASIKSPLVLCFSPGSTSPGGAEVKASAAAAVPMGPQCQIWGLPLQFWQIHLLQAVHPGDTNPWRKSACWDDM